MKNFKMYVTRYIDHSLQVDMVKLPNGEVIYNTSDDVDLSPMNNYREEILVIYINDKPTQIAKFTKSYLNQDNISQVDYEVIQNI